MPTNVKSPAAPVTRRQAQRRVDQIAAFRAELGRLEADAVLTLSPDESRAIQVHHDDLLARFARQFDVDRTSAEKQMSLGMRVASLLGALALSAAVFLFFYRFWGALSVPLQVALLVAAPIVAGMGVELAARREKTRYFASLLALVAFASFVLDLSVLATIFNLPPSPGGFLVWGVFAFVFAYGYRLRLLLLLGIGCVVILARRQPGRAHGRRLVCVPPASGERHRHGRTGARCVCAARASR